jgi:hypothetical protein
MTALLPRGNEFRMNREGSVDEIGKNFLSPTATLVRNDPVNAACCTLIEESMGCEDDQAELQGA